MRNDHERNERRSLEGHKLIADKLRQNPELLSIAWENIAKAREMYDGDVLLEWEAVLRAPIELICEFIQSNTQTAIRMRQSTPFAGILSQEERDAIWGSQKMDLSQDQWEAVYLSPAEWAARGKRER